MPGGLARGRGGEGFGGQADELPHTDHSGDVVRMVAEDRVVGVSVAADERDGLGERGVLAYEHGVGARHHDLVQGPLRERQCVVEEFGGVGRKTAPFVRCADQMAQLLQSGPVVEFLDGFDAHGAQQPGGGAVEDAYRGSDDLQVQERGGGQGFGEPFGDGECEVLRGQFAEDHLEEGGEREGEHDGDRRDGAVRQPGALQGRPEQRGDGRFGEEADDQARDGDAELGTGQHEGEAFEDRQRAAGALVPASASRARARRSAAT